MPSFSIPRKKIIRLAKYLENLKYIERGLALIFAEHTSNNTEVNFWVILSHIESPSEDNLIENIRTAQQKLTQKQTLTAGDKLSLRIRSFFKKLREYQNSMQRNLTEELVKKVCEQGGVNPIDKKLINIPKAFSLISFQEYLQQLQAHLNSKNCILLDSGGNTFLLKYSPEEGKWYCLNREAYTEISLEALSNEVNRHFYEEKGNGNLAFNVSIFSTNPTSALLSIAQTPAVAEMANIYDSNQAGALFHACRTNRIEDIQNLINAGADVNHRTTDGSTPLCMAAGNHPMAVKLLLKAGAVASINIGPPCGNPLLNAIYSNNLYMVDILLKSGADVNFKDQIGTPLFQVLFLQIQEEEREAIRGIRTVKYFPIIEKLLDMGAEINDAIAENDEMMEIIFTVAAGKADLNLVQELVDDVKTVRLNDALTLVLQKFNLAKDQLEKDKYFKVALILIKNGADPKPLANSNSPFFIAVKEGDLKTIAEFLENGLDVNIEDEHNNNALTLVLQNFNLAKDQLEKDKYFKVALILIKNGADPKPLANSNSPFFIAVKEGDLKTIAEFLENGLDVNIEDEHNNDALKLAVIAANLDLINLLLRHQAKVIRTDDFNPVFYTLNRILFTNSKDKKEKYLNIAKRLLTHNPSISLTTRGSPVFGAAELGDVDAIRMFLENGLINLDFCSEDENESLLIIAVRNNHLALVNYLLDHNINIDLYNKAKETALEIAVKMGHLKIFKLLRDKGASLRFGIGRAAFYLALNKLNYSEDKQTQENCLSIACLILETEPRLRENSIPEDVISIAIEHARTTNDPLLKTDFLKLVTTLLQKNLVNREVPANPSTGATALHLAIKGGLKDIILLLLSNPAHIYKKMVDGSTPLDLLSQNFEKYTNAEALNMLQAFVNLIRVNQKTRAPNDPDNFEALKRILTLFAQFRSFSAEETPLQNTINKAISRIQDPVRRSELKDIAKRFNREGRASEIGLFSNTEASEARRNENDPEQDTQSRPTETRLYKKE